MDIKMEVYRKGHYEGVYQLCEYKNRYYWVLTHYQEHPHYKSNYKKLLIDRDVDNKRVFVDGTMLDGFKYKEGDLDGY